MFVDRHMIRSKTVNMSFIFVSQNNVNCWSFLHLSIANVYINWDKIMVEINCILTLVRRSPEKCKYKGFKSLHIIYLWRLELGSLFFIFMKYNRGPLTCYISVSFPSSCNLLCTFKYFLLATFLLYTGCLTMFENS